MPGPGMPSLPLRAFAVCSDSQVGKRKKTQDDNIDMDKLDLRLAGHHRRGETGGAGRAG